MIYNQLLLIWSVAHQHHHTNSNPLQELVSERQEKQDQIYDLRDALVVRSFSRQNMYNLNTILDNDSEKPILALMMYMRTYLRLDSGEVGALTLGDYVKCPNANFMQLIICKTLPANGHTAIPLALKWENRVLPVPAFLQDKLDEFVPYRYSQLIESGVSKEDLDKMPLFHGNTATQPYRRKAINAYSASILQQLEIASIKLDLPDTEKLNDVGHYHKDILQTNWDYHIKQIASSANILSADDICYLSGKNP